MHPIGRVGTSDEFVGYFSTPVYRKKVHPGDRSENIFRLLKNPYPSPNKNQDMLALSVATNLKTINLF